MFLSILKTLFLLGIIFTLIFSFSTLADQKDAERQKLEQELAELETQIANYETTITEYQRQGKTLKKEINALDAKISKINLQIKSINIALAKLDSEIAENKKQIEITEDKIVLNKQALTKFLQQIYENDHLGLMAILLKSSRLSDFFGDFNDLIAVQGELIVTVNEITELHNQLLDENETLSLKKSDQITLKVYQDNQRKIINNTKNEKDDLLALTKGQESKYQSLLKDTQKTAVQIRSRIFQLIGGGELTFEKAYELAKFAEKATGIRAALILAVLDRESALGQNVGKCDYRTAMHPTRDIPVFLEIIKELKENGKTPPEPIMVSCPNKDGVYGGAMGPAQFIPSTWEIYKARIAEITGSNPPNPWSNADAFVGTALFLRDAYNSASCVNYAEQYKNVLPKKTLQERCAAAQYYAGNRWFTYRFVYGEPVVERADEFQKDIDILNS